LPDIHTADNRSPLIVRRPIHVAVRMERGHDALLTQSLDNACGVAHMPTPGNDDDYSARCASEKINPQNTYQSVRTARRSFISHHPVPGNLCSEATIQGLGST
jgi:hypothetical protein